MGNILFIDTDGNPVHSCTEECGIPEKGDSYLIEDRNYKVEEVKRVIKNNKISYHVHLKKGV